MLLLFGIGMKTDLFQSCCHCWIFQICWHIKCSTLTASSFRIWNSSAGIPSPPLTLWVDSTHYTSFIYLSVKCLCNLPPICPSSECLDMSSHWLLLPCHLDSKVSHRHTPYHQIHRFFVLTLCRSQQLLLLQTGSSVALCSLASLLTLWLLSLLSLWVSSYL